MAGILIKNRTMIFMKRKLIYVAPFLFFILLTACPSPAEDSENINIKNEWDHDISFYFSSYFANGRGDTFYPDTALSIEIWYRPVNVVKGKTYRDNVYPLERIYKRNNVDTLCFFIFATDTLNMYDWDTIRDEYKILQRYDLSLQDFKRLKNTITYPPTEEMKDMKMHPPYEGDQLKDEK
jgi:hypothetical protein